MTRYVQITTTQELALIDSNGLAQQSYSNEQCLVVFTTTVTLAVPFHIQTDKFQGFFFE